MEDTHPALRVPQDSVNSTGARSQAVNGEDVASPDSPKSTRGRSFSFLRRSKSTEPAEQAPQRSTSQSRKLIRRRKSDKKDEERRRKEANALPYLPSVQMLPNMSNPFLLDQSQPQPQPLSLPAQSSTQRLPRSSGPQPSSPKRWGYNPSAYYQRHQLSMDRAISPYASEMTGNPTPLAQPFDPFARTESMTNRGRSSYASSFISQGTNNQRRLRRRKEPTPFNVLVIGTKGCGKTSFIEFLRSSLSYPVKRFATSQLSPPGTASTQEHGSFTSRYLNTELEGERIGLTLYDSKGLERHLVDLQLREIAGFLESKFQETFQEEQKVMRTSGVKDTHIHCVLLILDPARLDANIAASSLNAKVSSPLGNSPKVIGGLDESLDIDVLRTLQGKTTVIPIISKADTVTTSHMAYLKHIVNESLKKIKFDPLDALNLDSDGDSDDIQEADENVEMAASDKDDSSFHDVKETTDDNDAENIDAYRVVPPTATPRAKDSLDTSQPPQHEEIRVSRLSTNMETPQLPMSIISPDVYEPGTVGRRFPWGFADPYNSQHCDFSRLKESVFSEWRADLRETSRERWYEGWRTSQMRRKTPTAAHNSTLPHREAPSATTGSGAYQSPPRVVTNGTTAQHRTVNSSDIGVAVSNPRSPVAIAK